jgi:hypothetical protein
MQAIQPGSVQMLAPTTSKFTTVAPQLQVEGSGAGSRQAFEGDGLLGGALRSDQLAPKALVPERIPPTVDRAPSLRVDLSLRGFRAPATGESFCSYLPGMDGRCLETFLDDLGEAYRDHHLVVVLDNAPSHLSKEIAHPQNSWWVEAIDALGHQ